MESEPGAGGRDRARWGGDPRVGDRWAVAAAFGGLAALAAWRALAAPDPVGGDVSQYLAHAWALVEGRPYTDTGYLYRPEAWLVGPPVQAPGLPVLLAPLLALFGRYSAAPQVLMYGLTAVFLAFSYARLRLDEPVVAAAAATLMAGAALLLLDVPLRVGSDLPYMVLVWIAIWLADRPRSGRPGPSPAEEGDRAAAGRSAPFGVRWLGVSLAGCGALTMRLAALPLASAAALWSLLGDMDRGRRLAWLGTGALWGATFAILFLGFDVGRTPGSDLVPGAAASPEPLAESGSRSGVAALLWQLRHNAIQYGSAIREAFLYPLPGRIPNHAYHVVALVLSAVGALAWLWRARQSLLFAFVVSTAAFLAVAPVATGRYLWVLYPVIALGFVRGLRALLRRYGAHAAGRWTYALVALLVAGAGLRVAASPPDPDRIAEPQRVLWAWAAQAIREDAGPGAARVVSNRPRHLAWYADLPAAHAVPGDTASAAVRDATHAVFDRRAWRDDWRPGADPLEPVAGWTLLERRGPLTVLRRDR